MNEILLCYVVVSENEPRLSRTDGEAESQRQLELDVPSLETALQAAPEALVDWHLGRGVVFRLGEGDARHASLELYAQVVRVTVPHGQLAVARRDAEVVPEGVVFQDPDQFFLAVGSTGEVRFRSWPPSPASETPANTTPETVPPQPGPLPEPGPGERAPSSPFSPAPDAKDKAKSERYVGRLGEVRTHRTKQGKLVAEVELTVADPERPGASRLVKFVAFGDKAETLAREYHPGQEVTAVGIPHTLQRRDRVGREWTEHQLYLVQLPKPR
jgi:hypothetical protein